MNPLVAYGVRNLRRSLRRTGLTGASVALGCGGLVLTFGYIHRIERYMEVAHAFTLGNGHLSIYKAPGYDTAHLTPAKAAFDPEEQAKLAAVLDADPGVLRHVPVLLGNGLLSNACRTQPYEAMGMDPEDMRWIWTHPEVTSRVPELAAVSAGAFPWTVPAEYNPVLITPGFASLLDKPAVHDPAHPKDPAFIDCTSPTALAEVRADPWVQLVSRTWDGGFGAVDAVVAGHFSTGFTEYESAALRAPLASLQALYGTQDITYEAVFFRDRTTVATALPRLQVALAAAGLDVVLHPWWSPVTSPNYTSVMPLLQVMGAFITLVMIWVVALALANAMTLSVLERTRELGTLRAVGYTPRALLLLLLGELGLLAAGSSALGAGGALLASAAINDLNFRFTPPGIAGSLAFQVRPEAVHVIVAVVLVLSVCAVSAVVAARRQVGRKVVDLLGG